MIKENIIRLSGINEETKEDKYVVNYLELNRGMTHKEFVNINKKIFEYANEVFNTLTELHKRKNPLEATKVYIAKMKAKADEAFKNSKIKEENYKKLSPLKSMDLVKEYFHLKRLSIFREKGL